MDTAGQLDELLICRLDDDRKALEPCTVVIFGATGDLTLRKLVPALLHLHRRRQMPESFRLLGFARRALSDEAWRASLFQAVNASASADAAVTDAWEGFASHLAYCQGDLEDPAAFVRLKQRLEERPGDAASRNVLFYLATAPTQFGGIMRQLHVAGLLPRGDAGEGWRRVVVEKPFGQDLASARRLNDELTGFAHEKQIFRIDHYLGKETVQNILVLRFANAVMEPLWNRQCIDHIQITVSEKSGVGSRGPYYEEAGALRDMVQNHLLQVLALVAMEPPSSLQAEAIRDEKTKLLGSIRPVQPPQAAHCAVRGQYAAGTVDGQLRSAYRQETRVRPDSQMETFAALRLMIDTWRWSGVPFYLRTGKNLPVSASEVRVQFRSPPHVLFAAQCGPHLDDNALTLRLQPAEGITLRLNGKIPGIGLRLRPVRMSFRYDTEFRAYTPEAYERLLLDAMAGDATLFLRRDLVEASWRVVDPIREAWDAEPLTSREFYAAGTWGPEAAADLLSVHGRQWRNPEPGG